jgi:hypothetical protein
MPLRIPRDVTEVAALHQQLVNALNQIDRALDRRDRRAFRIWSGCYRDRSSRCGTLLLALAAKR